MIRLMSIFTAAIVAAAVVMGAGYPAPTDVGDPPPTPPDPPAPPEVVPDENPDTQTRNKTVTEEQPANPVVIIETSMGTIKAELWKDKAPITVANFETYVARKFYDGLIFHRVMKDFMIQGGGFDADMKQKATLDQIKNEATADKPNDRGTLAMARTAVIDSATSQFFINLVDNGFLNHRDDSPRGFGYCAFGKVIEGMDVVDKIGAVAVKFNNSPRPEKSVPIDPVFIKSIRRAE